MIDRIPRGLTAQQEKALQALSRQVMRQLELRKALAELHRHNQARPHYELQLEEYQRKLEQTNAELELQSVTDALTGLKNRRAFEERLDEEWDRASRHQQSLSLAILDVDHFKSYNDRFGHQAGDEALRKIARLLEENLRNSDFVARYGGEEFAVIFPGTESGGAYILAERLRRSVQLARWEHREVTISVGWCSLAGGVSSRSALVAAADQALYRSKENGRNRICQAKNQHEPIGS